MELTKVVMYLLIFGIAIVVALIEGRDWKCLNAYSPEGCISGEGMPYRGSKPESSDDVSTLLNKIDIAASAETESIKWRRALTLGVASVLLTSILVFTPGKLPKWTKFYTATLLMTTVLYYSFNYYSYHMYQTPQNNIRKTTELLRKKI